MAPKADGAGTKKKTLIAAIAGNRPETLGIARMPPSPSESPYWCAVSALRQPAPRPASP